MKRHIKSIHEGKKYKCKKVQNTKKQRQTPKLPKLNDESQNENIQCADFESEIENSKMETENEIGHLKKEYEEEIGHLKKEIMELKEKLQVKTATNINKDNLGNETENISLKKDILIDELKKQNDDLKKQHEKDIKILKKEIIELKEKQHDKTASTNKNKGNFGSETENISLKKDIIDELKELLTKQNENLQCQMEGLKKQNENLQCQIEGLKKQNEKDFGILKNKENIQTINKTNDNHIINPSDYHFEHGIITKKEVKEEFIEKEVKKEVIEEVTIKEEAKE